MANIVVVDDDPLTLQLVTAILESAGHAITQADGGDAGIEAVTGGVDPDLVVTDLNMRGTSGWDLVRRIRESGNTDLPVLAVSAFTSAQDRDEAFNAGCTAYIRKPIDKDRLVEKVAELLP